MLVENRKAEFNFDIVERFEAGIVLTGAEVKAVRASRVDIMGTHAKVLGGEVYLINSYFYLPKVSDQEKRRTRKLLLHKKEILDIEAKIKQKKLTLVPLKLYTKGQLIKVELALARARRKYEKREKLKKRSVQRDISRELKG